MKPDLVGALLGAALVLGACAGSPGAPGDGSAGAGGAGGSGGTGGAAGAGGLGGAGAGGGAGGAAGAGGSGGAGACTGPACLTDIFKECPLSGTCTKQDLGGDRVNLCYASGVKYCSSKTGPTVKKPDGSVCFTTVYSRDMAGNVVITFMNPSGATLATVSFKKGGSSTSRLTCGGATYDLDLNACFSGGCTKGTCSC